jgi:hypothetical protein
LGEDIKGGTEINVGLFNDGGFVENRDDDID